MLRRDITDENCPGLLRGPGDESLCVRVRDQQPIAGHGGANGRMAEESTLGDEVLQHDAIVPPIGENGSRLTAEVSGP